MSVAVDYQSIDFQQPPAFEGWDEWYLEREGLINECGSINFPWLISMSAMIGNSATVGMFHNPHYYSDEYGGSESTGFGSGNYSGKAGHGAIGGTTIWW